MKLPDGWGDDRKLRKVDAIKHQLREVTGKREREYNARKGCCHEYLPKKKKN